MGCGYVFRREFNLITRKKKKKPLYNNITEDNIEKKKKNTCNTVDASVLTFIIRYMYILVYATIIAATHIEIDNITTEYKYYIIYNRAVYLLLIEFYTLQYGTLVGFIGDTVNRFVLS